MNPIYRNDKSTRLMVPMLIASEGQNGPGGKIWVCITSENISFNDAAIKPPLYCIEIQIFMGPFWDWAQGVIPLSCPEALP